MRIHKFCAAALLTVVCASPALAWNDTGHMLVALIAYDELSVPARDAMARTLRSHPRFEEDFAALMPRRVQNASRAEQDRWLFAFASTWPDRVRRFAHVQPVSARAELIEQYHRPNWHFINFFMFLESEDRASLGDVDVNQCLDWTVAESPEELNIVQALGMLVSEYHAPTIGEAERAVMLSWILHLIGDLHQPLHTTALFTSRAFPNGDRGGNNLSVDSRTNLHSLWDGALGGDRRWGSLLRQLETFRAIEQPPWPEEELNGTLPHHFAGWAHEGHRIAVEHAYVPEILVQVATANTEPRRFVRIDVPAAYRENLRHVASVQVLVAGWRMAWVLEQLDTGRHTAGADECLVLGCADALIRVAAARP
jgi:hypothetical protein